MFTQSAIKLLSRPLLSYAPRSFFSSHSKQLKAILQKVAIDVDGKPTNLLDSGMIEGQHID